MSVHPYRCPRGHASIELGRDRAWCETCRNNDLTAAFDKSAVTDLRDQ